MKGLPLAMVALLLSFGQRSSAAYVTSCSAGSYLILDESDLSLRQGLCATCAAVSRVKTLPFSARTVTFCQNRLGADLV